MKKLLSSFGLLLLGSIATLGAVYAQGAVKDFPDVDSSAYYFEALQDINSRGIVNGYQNGNFGPNDAVTRAQLVTILKRFDDSQVNAYHRGGIGKLQTLICASINKEDLASESEGWGKPQEVYDEVCTLP
ncbi:MAG: S-layer homology domain-containing protein [Candidatus Gracilibacteria bacterium]|nr:S-layer homology domain-containing protein [Candidatus Gracilibacteria bacterium]